MKKFALIACAAALSLGACAKNPDGTINWTLTSTNYTQAANATATVLKEIGNDLVAIDCANAGLIQVIAQDAGAASRVQSALAKNAAIARDACPLLTGKPAIQVIASG